MSVCESFVSSVYACGVIMIGSDVVCAGAASFVVALVSVGRWVHRSSLECLASRPARRVRTTHTRKHARTHRRRTGEDEESALVQHKLECQVGFDAMAVSESYGSITIRTGRRYLLQRKRMTAEEEKVTKGCKCEFIMMPVVTREEAFHGASEAAREGT